MATVLERMSGHRCDLGHQSTSAGLGNYSTDESALNLHLDQAGGNCNKEEKPVDLKITYGARNKRGVGVSEATQVLPGHILPDWTGAL